MLLVISSPIPLPAQRIFSESFIPFPKPLSLSRGEVYGYDLNITYQSPHTNFYSTPNSTVYGLLDKPPQNTPTLFWNMSLSVGVDLNSTDAYLWILEPFEPSGHTIIYGSQLPLPDSAGQLSVVKTSLQGLGLYRIQVQNNAISTAAGTLTFQVRYNLFTRSQSNYATVPLALALVIALGAPAAFYMSQRRSHHPSSLATP